jgi:hypothetical protein
MLYALAHLQVVVSMYTRDIAERWCGGAVLEMARVRGAGARLLRYVI